MKKSNKPIKADLDRRNYVNGLKATQIFGYIWAVYIGLRIGNLFGVLGFLSTTIGIAIFSFISTQGVIVVIDLLSRIEYNTRSKSNNDQDSNDQD